MIRALMLGAAMTALMAGKPGFAQGHEHHQAAETPCSPEHAAMGHCNATATPLQAERDPAASGAAPAPVPADYADRIWGREAMLESRETLRRDHGGGSFSKIMLDRAEARIGGGRESWLWEAEAWAGGDVDRLVLKGEGEGAFGGEGIEQIEAKALYSRAIDPYFNLQAGARHDFRDGPDRTYAVIGIEGLAPYWFEVEAYLHLSTKGELLASAAAEYDQRLTQRLILQPRVEAEFAAQDIPEIGIGSGITGIEAGLRLRYEIVREFAPYVGIVHESLLGRTADMARAGGAERSSTRTVLGLRAWF